MALSVKERAARLGRAILKGGDIRSHYPELAHIAGYLLNFLLGFAMASARIFQVAAPFGIGIVSQAGSGLGGVVCLIGTALGYLATGGFDWGIKYIATSVMVYTAAFMFQDLKASRNNFFMPMITVIITAITGFLNSFDLIGPLPVPVMLATESILAGGSGYFFRIALDEGGRDSEIAELVHSVSVLILISCALMSLSNLILLRVISVGRTAALLIVMTAAFCGGYSSGAAAGATLGLAMDIAAGGTPFFSMAYSFSGMLGGVFHKHGKLAFLLAYILANAVASLWTWGSTMRIELLFEVFVGSMLFLMVPARHIQQAGSIFKVQKIGEGEAGLRRYSAARLQRLSDTFRDLFDTVRLSMERGSNDNELATVFDRAADTACMECRGRDGCWQRDYFDTLNALNDGSAAMMKRGRLERGDLPEHFIEKCEHPEELISAINGELRGLMYRRSYRAKLRENRAAAYGQYAEMSAILDNAAHELDLASGPDPLGERRLLRYLQSLDIEAEVAVFRERGGRLRAVIESARLTKLTSIDGYLEKLSSILGTRLCRPSDDVKAEGRLVLMEAEPLAVSVGIAAVKKKGEEVSGDRGTYFKTDSGVLCVILSDGMGTGGGAARESIAAVRILENFLRSGVDPGTAMKILNSVTLLRGDGDWGYCTVDLVCIDLFSGEASFYKYGAAPSYVRHGKLIRKVNGTSMGAGLYAGDCGMPDIVRMRLRPGSVALVGSDGVLGGGGDAWLRDMLSSFEGTDTRTFARDTLEAAIERYGCEDDMTVLAVCIEKREVKKEKGDKLQNKFQSE